MSCAGPNRPKYSLFDDDRQCAPGDHCACVSSAHPDVCCYCGADPNDRDDKPSPASKTP